MGDRACRLRPQYRWALLTIALLLPSIGLGAPKESDPQSCAGGRFFVVDGALGDVLSQHQPLILARTARDTRIAIGDICEPVKATVKTTIKGTRVRGKWAQCSELHGKLRLKATILPGCDVVSGTLRTKKPKGLRLFTLQRSRCGDGITDTDGGENCEEHGGCVVGERCTDVCTCITDTSVTTTTTAYSTTTTTEPLGPGVSRSR